MVFDHKHRHRYQSPACLQRKAILRLRLFPAQPQPIPALLRSGGRELLKCWNQRRCHMFHLGKTCQSVSIYPPADSSLDIRRLLCSCIILQLNMKSCFMLKWIPVLVDININSMTSSPYMTPRTILDLRGCDTCIHLQNHRYRPHLLGINIEHTSSSTRCS